MLHASVALRSRQTTFCRKMRMTSSQQVHLKPFNPTNGLTDSHRERQGKTTG